MQESKHECDLESIDKKHDDEMSMLEILILFEKTDLNYSFQVKDEALFQTIKSRTTIESK